MRTILIILGLFSVVNVQAKQIFNERSLYRHIIVSETNGVRCLHFKTKKHDRGEQSCIMPANPSRVIFEYMHGILSAYTYTTPKKILIIGLGGGVLPQILHKLSPDATITSVEIDPVVVKVAHQFFDYQESDKINTIVKDARVFSKRAIKKGETYDWIILDAFSGDSIPAHLMTQEFYQEIASLLTPNGLVIANSVKNSRLSDNESATLHSVFNELLFYTAPTHGNRVIFACNCAALPKFYYNQSVANKLKSTYDLDLKMILLRMSNRINWDVNSPILTDQYAPVNILINQKRTL